MFVTRPLSLYRNHPSALLARPPSDSPCTGFIVVSDEESEEMDTFCWGICKSNRIKRLPFPQDRILNIVHTSEHEQSRVSKVWFIPVPDQPLSSNRYYAIKAGGYHKGQAYTCSREDGIETCCYNNVRVDAKPQPFDHRDVYQQFEIRPYGNGGFYAIPVAWDGFPPKFLRKRGWEVHISHSFRLHLREAQGIRTTSLSDVPEFHVPLLPRRSSPIIIGKWYCPFVFVKERAKVKEQMKASLFYELTLKQWWEQIYSCENQGDRGNMVVVDACVRKFVTLVYGMEAEKQDTTRNDGDGFIWFRAKARYGKKATAGLSRVVYEKLRWVQESRGWFDGGVEDVRVEGENEIRSENGWRRFGCYVLVESFVFRRVDGSLLINFNFKNSHRIQCKCE
ncbi:unnamed protein product [Coffea canephora]|uniref:Uncharacterized protein n=1 Tax=Coffea canephora TaxID=49390 RepID=A0A068U4J4_COFCA|nr:unnamed protein product [Coffea canephora]